MLDAWGAHPAVLATLAIPSGALKIDIGQDGTISILGQGTTAEMQIIDKLKLVKGEASELDHARVGLLVARDGLWGDRRVLPEGWVRELRRPSALNPGYGLLWWLNTGRRQLPAAPETSFFALGAGNHVIWIDPALDLVVVLRWILKTAIAGFAERLVAALD